MNKKYDLEDRLIKFSCSCLAICDILPNSRVGNNLEFQLCKSSTASALIYGEAQAAESKADFLHKLKLVLKEIRETRVNLKIILGKPIINHPIVESTLAESNELMAIFLKSIETARNKELEIRKL